MYMYKKMDGPHVDMTFKYGFTEQGVHKWLQGNYR